MNHIIEFDTPLFTDEYEFQKVLAIPPSFKRSLILLFKHKKTRKEVVVKCMQNDDEVVVLHRVEKMRKTLEGTVGAEFIRSHGYCKISDPFVSPDYKYAIALYIQSKEKETKRRIKIPEATSDVYYAIIMDSVPLSFEQLKEEEGFRQEKAIMIGFELLYTLWLARKQFQFFHGDLQASNIMFRDVEEPEKKTRRYVVGGKTFVVKYKYRVVIIDYEKSIFSNLDDKKFKENLSDVRRVVRDIMDGELGVDREGAFLNLYDLVGREGWNDSRFTPENIEQILTDPQGVFATLEDTQGGGESSMKKIKFCIECKTVEATLKCNQCGVPVCSSKCWNKIKTCKEH
jgi:hypothetical protein